MGLEKRRVCIPINCVNIGMKKHCKKCNQTKDISEFSFRKETNSYRGVCKQCKNQRHRELYPTNYKEKKLQYYQENKEELLSKNKERRRNNPEQYKERDRLYNEKNREKRLAYDRAYYQANKEKRKAYSAAYNKKRRAEDPVYKMIWNTRRRINLGLKGECKSAPTEELIGCSFEEYRSHIESQWEEGMNWDNYGLHGWHIDHIIPISSFDLSDPEEQKKAFGYKNTQPMWAKDNLSKGAKKS